MHIKITKHCDDEEYKITGTITCSIHYEWTFQ